MIGSTTDIGIQGDHQRRGSLWQVLFGSKPLGFLAAVQQAIQ